MESGISKKTVFISSDKSKDGSEHTIDFIYFTTDTDSEGKTNPGVLKLIIRFTNPISKIEDRIIHVKDSISDKIIEELAIALAEEALMKEEFVNQDIFFKSGL